jgi:hypothetical protein
MKNLPYLFLLFSLISCKNQPESNSLSDVPEKTLNRSKAYDTTAFNYFESLYIPVYSEIYHLDGTRQMLLTVTLSIRNTSQTDTIAITRSDYFDSEGNKLRVYIDSAILLYPLQSKSFIVEYAEKEGGAGASFIVDWVARKNESQALVQAVMIGTSGQQGISFVTEAKVIKSTDKTRYTKN